MSNFFQYIVTHVSRLKRGETFTVDAHRLGQGWGGALGSLLGNGFTPADRVLENVIGSSVTHRYTQDRVGDTTFHRLHSDLPEDVRSYVSPDRRGYFDRRADGLYQHREGRLTSDDEQRIRCALDGHHWVKAWVMPELEPMPAYSDVVVAETTVQLVEGKRCGRCGAYS